MGTSTTAVLQGLQFNGDSTTLNTFGTVNIGGTIVFDVTGAVGSYTVAPDCTGTLSITGGPNFNIYVGPGAQKVWTIQSSPTPRQHRSERGNGDTSARAVKAPRLTVARLDFWPALRVWRVLSAPNPFNRRQRFVAEVADRDCPESSPPTTDCCGRRRPGKHSSMRSAWTSLMFESSRSRCNSHGTSRTTDNEKSLSTTAGSCNGVSARSTGERKASGSRSDVLRRARYNARHPERSRSGSREVTLSFESEIPRLRSE